MLNEFHRHPDGNVYVRRDDGKFYVDTPAHFAADFGQALPQMPPGASEQIYTKDFRHAYISGNNILSGGPMPYTYGDQAIAALDSLLSKQALRPPVIPPVPGQRET